MEEQETPDNEQETTGVSRPPTEKRCNKCHRSVSEGAEFGREKREADGLNRCCKACRRARAKALYRPNSEADRAQDRAWYQANREHVLARKRAWRLSNLAKVQALRKKRYWRNREKALAEHRAWYEQNRQKAIEYTRKWRQQNRPRYLERLRRWRERKKAAINAHKKELYWQDVEHSRWLQRRAHWRRRDDINRRNRLIRAEKRQRAGKRHESDPARSRFYSPYSLDAQRAGSGGGLLPSMIERVSDPSAANPADVVLTKETQAAALQWVSEKLSEEETTILTAFADTGFDVAETAALLQMPQGTVQDMLRAIQERARAEVPLED